MLTTVRITESFVCGITKAKVFLCVIGCYIQLSVNAAYNDLEILNINKWRLLDQATRKRDLHTVIQSRKGSDIEWQYKVQAIEWNLDRSNVNRK